MTTFDLRALLAALVRGDVDFVVIGGIAVGAHGFVRATEDLDLVPAPDRDNIDRLVNALVRLDGRLESARHLREQERQALRRGRNLTVTTIHGAVDVVQRLPGVPSYTELEEASVSTAFSGTPLRVCSLAHLRQMKSVRGSHQDLADLEKLPQP
jgi:hypothetical protein